MQKKKIEELKALLTENKRQILSDVRRAMESPLNDDIRLTFEVLQDNGDKSVDELLKHVNAKILGNKSEILDEIDEALNKLEEGTYGICEECGTEIPLGRLKAVPSATLCVDCQEGIDKKNKVKSSREENVSIPEDVDNLPEDEK
jgi:DnaK suppressor protein